MTKKLTFTIVSTLAIITGSYAKGTPHHNKNEMAALKAQIEMLTKQVQELQTQKEQTGVLHEKEVVTHSNNLGLKISGQVNRSVLWTNNGRNSNIAHVDPTDNSSSRINITAEGKMNEDTMVGATLEAELRSNASSNVDVKNVNDNNTTFQRRIVEVYADSKRWGKLAMGHGDMASNATMEATDFSKTDAMAWGATVGDMAGGATFYNTSSAAKATLNGQNLTVNRVFDSADGLGRMDRIRYNTTDFYGFSFHTSHAYRNTNDNWDAALKWAGKFQGTKLAAQVAYVSNLSNTIGSASAPAKYKQVNGSVGVLFPMGISLMLAAANRDWKTQNVKDGTVYFGKIGYQHQFFECGMTAFAFDYGHYNRMLFDTTSGQEKDKYRGKVYGMSLVQFLDRIATEVYLTARMYQLNGPSQRTPRYKDITAIMGGARVKF